MSAINHTVCVYTEGWGSVLRMERF